jgi:hypothetical protein
MAYGRNRYGRYANRSCNIPVREQQPRKTIEYGWAWTSDIVVYEVFTYPRGSALAGQQRHDYLGTYPTIEAAKAAHPDAVCLISNADSDRANWLRRHPSLQECIDDSAQGMEADLIYEERLPHEMD